ncbi:MAG: aspartate carbamoyltransferase catalytic subunit [Dehalococcoidia bacterium]|nr:aspartate carbamoyltransferase catalytic subunit [Dehalococcoidia bacterium]MDW8120400.1 aspartate carbamoyltransferase catalytic subunit [Chloroflexota bacterium]
MQKVETTPARRKAGSASVPWPHRHILDLDTFAPQEISLVLDLATSMKEVLGREVKKLPSLRGKTVITCFYEPSTRTRISFETAGKLLSADVINMQATGSSVEKGESLVDTLLTLQATACDVLVLRHPHAGAPYLAARWLGRTSVINAGDGTHAHPTQALLDLFTLREHLGTLEGRTIVIVGDIAHSRVARSNLWGMTKMGMRVVLCAPPTLLPWDLLKGRRETPGHPFASVEVETDLDKALEGADAVMALRLQKERMEAGLIPSLREYIALYQVNERRLLRARPGALVLHPGPMNEGVEISPAVAHGSQSVIQEQVTNGVAVRMALLYLLCMPAGGRP